MQDRAPAHRSFRHFSQEVIRVPDLLSKLAIKLAPIVYVALLELCMRSEWQAARFHEAKEPGVVIITLWVQRTGEQVLGVVLRELLLEGKVPIAGVETLLKQ